MSKPRKEASVIIESSRNAELIEREGVSIKPNPTYGILNIKTTLDAKISVLDYTGKIVLNAISFANQEQILNLADVSAGIYYVVVTNGQSKHTFKISKL